MPRIQVNTISSELRNHIINGNFDIWQRGTSFATPSNSSYTSDRWHVRHDGTIGTFTLSRQTFTLGQTDVPNEPTYFLRWDQTAAGSDSSQRHIRQRIESVRTLAGKKMTVSLWLKADSSRTVGISMTQAFGTGGSPSAAVTLSTQDLSVTTSWQKFSVVFDLPSISGKTIGTDGNDYLELRVQLPLNTTMTIDLAQVMLHEGSGPSNFKLAGEDFAGEVELCQRYFEKSYALTTNPGSITASGVTGGRTNSSNNTYIDVRFRTRKRAAPTVTTYNHGTGAQGSWREDGPTERATSVGAESEIGFTVAFGSLASTGILGHWTAEAEL